METPKLTRSIDVFCSAITLPHRSCCGPLPIHRLGSYHRRCIRDKRRKLCFGNTRIVHSYDLLSVGKMHDSFVPGSTLVVDVIALTVGTATLVVLVGQVEMLTFLLDQLDHVA